MNVPLLYIGNGQIAKRFSNLAGDGMTVFPDVGAASDAFHKLHKTEFIVLFEQSFAKTDIVDVWLIRTMCPEAAIVLVTRGDLTEEEKQQYIRFGVTDMLPLTADGAGFEQVRKRVLVSVPEVEDEGKEDTVTGEYVRSRAKRAFDVVYSLCAMVVLSPLMLVLTVWLRLTQRGKVFVKEERVGTNFNMFSCHGFRVYDKTETEAAEGGRRLTRNGKMLVRLGLARLPMLVNVLKGDISVVGNEPMTLARAQTMTSDENVGTFLCPFGMKDNASVLRRHLRRELTEEETKGAEREYAGSYGYDTDVEIFMTIPLFQGGRTI